MKTKKALLVLPLVGLLASCAGKMDEVTQDEFAKQADEREDALIAKTTDESPYYKKITVKGSYSDDFTNVNETGINVTWTFDQEQSNFLPSKDNAANTEISSYVYYQASEILYTINTSTGAEDAHYFAGSGGFRVQGKFSWHYTTSDPTSGIDMIIDTTNDLDYTFNSDGLLSKLVFESVSTIDMTISKLTTTVKSDLTFSYKK